MIEFILNMNFRAHRQNSSKANFTHEVLTDLSDFTTLHDAILTKSSKVFLVAAGCLFFSGCSILVGNVKPITEKSESYRVLELDKEYPDWKKVEVEKNISAPNAAPSSATNLKPEDPAQEPSDVDSDTTDLAYQSTKTASIISLNTACRPRNASEDGNLRQFTDTLILGVSDISDRVEKSLTLEQQEALETTLSGKMNGEPMKLKLVVSRKETCIYDFMYVARPKHFNQHVGVFDRFVLSLRFR